VVGVVVGLRQLVGRHHGLHLTDPAAHLGPI
jgi:hypothetical protein